MSPDFFTAHVASELRWIRRGRLQFVGVRELARWVDENGEQVFDLEVEGEPPLAESWRTSLRTRS